MFSIVEDVNFLVFVNGDIYTVQRIGPGFLPEKWYLDKLENGKSVQTFVCSNKHELLDYMEEHFEVNQEDLDAIYSKCENILKAERGQK